MCDVYLGEGNIRREIENDVALKTWATSRDGLLNYVNHCEADTYFVAAIAMRVQILPLSKVLTNLAGNSWARTLSGTRAERNEYILLHEFNKNKYICPDKIYGKGKVHAEEETLEGEEVVDAKKKDKFKGGLVFEPEKGALRQDHHSHGLQQLVPEYHTGVQHLLYNRRSIRKGTYHPLSPQEN